MAIRKGLHGLLDAGLDAVQDVEKVVDDGLAELSERYAVPEWMHAAEMVMRSWQKMVPPRAEPDVPDAADGATGTEA
jgi:hypothetical protein